MKAETQADSLASLVEKKKPYPEYELVFPFFQVKQSALKKLLVDDILLLGLSHMDLSLLFEGTLCASVSLCTEDNNEKIKITYLQKDTLKQEHTKKYKILKCSFGSVQIRKLEIGHKASVAQLDLEKTDLFVNDTQIAAGRLITVDDEIAIQITKVNDE